MNLAMPAGCLTKMFPNRSRNPVKSGQSRGGWLEFCRDLPAQRLVSRWRGPFPGAEFAGVVDALGDGVSGFKVGEPVATANGEGGYAEYALCPAARLVPVPAAITLEQAAAVLLQGMTAHYLALSTYPLKPGDTALIHAAAGGVGQLLVQIAKKQGATVIATVSTAEKARLAREAGADHVILYSELDFEAETKRLTGGQGVEVVYDGVGKTTFDQGLNCLKPRGTWCCMARPAGGSTRLTRRCSTRKARSS